jgi:hypothetical protein
MYCFDVDQPFSTYSRTFSNTGSAAVAHLNSFNRLLEIGKSVIEINLDNFVRTNNPLAREPYLNPLVWKIT